MLLYTTCGSIGDKIFKFLLYKKKSTGRQKRAHSAFVNYVDEDKARVHGPPSASGAHLRRDFRNINITCGTVAGAQIKTSDLKKVL